MQRLSYLSKNENEFYERLDKMMDISARSLKIKRTTVTKLMEAGLYPYTKRYLGSFDNHFSTIGLVGMNEACLNASWLACDMTDVRAQKFTQNVLNHMRERLSDYQEKYGDLYNLEATPAESTSYRLAKHDQKLYPDMIFASKKGETPYYTNSSHLPVSFTSDVFDALDIQDELQTLYTSGTVFHAFLGERLPNWKSAMKLVRTIAENYKLPYYTMSPTYSVCQDHGYIKGEVYECPKCRKKTEVYSRITGYYRPIQNWNDGKAQEWKERKEYTPQSSVLKKCLMPTETEEQKAEVCVVRPMLFVQDNCPNCKMAEIMLNKEHIDVELINAMDHADLSKKFDIKLTPTLIVADGDSYAVYENASNVRKYIETTK